MNLLFALGGAVPQFLMPFIALTMVGTGLKFQVGRSFVQDVLLGKLALVLGIGTTLFIMGSTSLEPQTQVQAALDLSFETVFYPYVANPTSSLMFTTAAIPYRETVSRINDFIIYAASRTKDSWNRFRALIAIQFTAALGRPFKFAASELSWSFLFDLFKGGAVGSFQSVGETVRILFDWLLRDLLLLPFTDIKSWRIGGVVGDYIDILIETLVCFVELLRDFYYSLLTLTIISEDCEMCRLADGRTCTFVGRDINLGLFVLEAQCPTGNTPRREPHCFQFIERAVNCTARLLMNVVPLGVVVNLMADAISSNVGNAFRQWVFDLERAMVCFLSLFKTPLFIFMSVVDNALRLLTGGRVGAPCINSVGAILQRLIGWIFTDPGRSVFNCLGRLLSALTLGAFDDFIRLLFRYLLPIITEIIDSVERLLGCYLLDTAISNILFTFPGGMFFHILGQELNGPGRCRLTSTFLGFNIGLPFTARQGLQTYFLAASECVCDDSDPERPVPVPVAIVFCTKIGGESLLAIVTVALSIVTDTILCTFMPVINSLALIAPRLFKDIVEVGSIIVEVFKALNPMSPQSGADAFCRLVQKAYDILFLLDEFFTRASHPGVFRGVRFVWFVAFRVMKWIIETLVKVFNFVLAIIRTVLSIIEALCRLLNRIIKVVNDVVEKVEGLIQKVKSVGNGVAKAGNTVGSTVGGCFGLCRKRQLPPGFSPTPNPGIQHPDFTEQKSLEETSCSANQGDQSDCKLEEPEFNFPGDVTKRSARDDDDHHHHRREPVSPAWLDTYIDAASGMEMFNLSRHECIRAFDGSFNCHLLHVGISVDHFARYQQERWMRDMAIRDAHDMSKRRARTDWRNFEVYVQEAARETESHWSGHRAHESPAMHSSHYKLTERDRARAFIGYRSLQRATDRLLEHLDDDVHRVQLLEETRAKRRSTRMAQSRYNNKRDDGAKMMHDEDETDYVYMTEEEYQRYVVENDKFPPNSNKSTHHLVVIHYYKTLSQALDVAGREHNITGHAVLQKITLLEWDAELHRDGLLPDDYYNEVIKPHRGFNVTEVDYENVASYRAAASDYMDRHAAEMPQCTRWIQQNPLLMVMNGSDIIGSGSPVDSMSYIFCLVLYSAAKHARETTNNVTCDNLGECLTLWGFLNNMLPFLHAELERHENEDLRRAKAEILDKWETKIWEQGDDVAQEEEEARARDEQHGTDGGARQRKRTVESEMTWSDMFEAVVHAPRTGADMVRRVREQHRLAGIPHYRELKRMEARGEPFPWELFKDKVFERDYGGGGDNSSSSSTRAKRDATCDEHGEQLHVSISPLSEYFEHDALDTFVPPTDHANAPRYTRATLGEVILKRWVGGKEEEEEGKREEEGTGIVMPSLLNTRRPWHFVHEAMQTFAVMVQRQYGSQVAARVLKAAAHHIDNRTLALESAFDQQEVVFMEEGDTFSEAIYTAVLDLAYACTQSRLFQFTLSATDSLRRMPTNQELDLLAAHPEVQEALGDLEGGLLTRMMLRGMRVRATNEVTLQTANEWDRHLRSWDHARRMIDAGLDEGARRQRRRAILAEHDNGYPSLAPPSTTTTTGLTVRHREMRNFLERTMLVSDVGNSAVTAVTSAADAVEHMIQLARGDSVHSELRRLSGADRLTREWLFGEQPTNRRQQHEMVTRGVNELRDHLVEAAAGGRYRIETVTNTVGVLANAAGAQHSPIVQRGLFMAAAMRGEISNEQVWCMAAGECGYVPDRGVVTLAEWEESQRNIPLSERGVLNAASHVVSLGEMLWPHRFPVPDDGGTGEEEETGRKRHYKRPSIFGEGVHQTNLSAAAMAAARLREKYAHAEKQRQQVFSSDQPFLFEFVGGSPASWFDVTANHDDEEGTRDARRQLIGNWSFDDAVRRSKARQSYADHLGVRLLTRARARELDFVRDAGDLWRADGTYVVQGTEDGEPTPVPPGGTPTGRSFDATIGLSLHFLQPLLNLIFRIPDGAQTLVGYLDTLPEAFIGLDFESFFKKLFETTIPNFFKNLVKCKRPDNYDGTELYSPFCLPLLPEAIFRDVLEPTIPNKLFGLQIPWSKELIARDCHKVSTTRDTRTPTSSNLLFTFKMQDQCGQLEWTSDHPTCLQQCCVQMNRCDLQDASTLNSQDATMCLQQCCSATAGCQLVPNCGFGDDVEIGPGVRGVGLDCTMANVQPTCVNACCENGAQLCNTSDPASLMRGDARQCLRFCCNGYATFGGKCPDGLGCPGSGDCQNFCVERFRPGPDPVQFPVVADLCELFPECPTWDYCQRLYISCKEAGYSDVADVGLFVTGVIPFVVRLLNNRIISVFTIERVMLTVSLLVASAVTIPAGPFGILFLLPVHTVISVLFYTLLWLVIALFPADGGQAVPLGIIAPVLYFGLMAMPVIGALVRLLTPTPVRKMIVTYMMITLILYLLPPFEFEKFVDINGGALRTFVWIEQNLAVVARVWDMQPWIQRLQQFDYMRLGRVPGFHVYCNVWAWEPWGLLAMSAALAPVVGSAAVWALSTAQAALAFVATFYQLMVAMWLYFTASQTADNAKELEELSKRISMLEGSNASRGGGENIGALLEHERQQLPPPSSAGNNNSLLDEVFETDVLPVLEHAYPQHIQTVTNRRRRRRQNR